MEIKIPHRVEDAERALAALIGREITITTQYGYRDEVVEVALDRDELRYIPLYDSASGILLQVKRNASSLKVYFGPYNMGPTHFFWPDFQPTTVTTETIEEAR